MTRKTSLVRIMCLTLAFGMLTACAATYSNHGYIPPEDELAEIVVGIDTRATVEDSVGPPASGGVLEESGYYYVRSRVRSRGITAPEVIEREVLAISFDPDGVVSNIERFGLEDGRVVPISRRITESGIRSQTFLRQLLGNIGRISPAGLNDG